MLAIRLLWRAILGRGPLIALTLYRYACSWLALDVFASFPFELFSTLFCTSLRSTTCRAREVLKMNRVLRLNRLVKTIEIKAAASRTAPPPQLGGASRRWRWRASGGGDGDAGR